MKFRFGLFALAAAILSAAACSHPLTVKNYELYEVPTKFSKIDQKPDIAVLPFSGHADDIFYFNALVDKLNTASTIGDLSTDYDPEQNAGDPAPPDFVVSIEPTVEYKSSGWNFFINWPGFLLLTPAWNGYIYYADILTRVTIREPDGRVVSQFDVPVSYNIRQAEFDRTLFTGVTWLEASVLAFTGGLYNATVFDRDIIGSLQIHLKDNYSNYVANEMLSRLSEASGSLALSSLKRP